MLNVNERIYGLSLIWSEAKYNFVYWNRLGALDWDGEYRAAMERVSLPMDDLEYFLTLSRFITLLNDGHTLVAFPDAMSDSFRALPVRMRLTGSEHVVINVAEGCPVPPFSRVTAINGTPIAEYMENTVFPHCWHAKASSACAALYQFAYLSGNSDKNAYAFIPVLEKGDVRLATTSGEFTLSKVERMQKWRLPECLVPSEKLRDIYTSDSLTVRAAEDDIAVITLPSFMDNSMPTAFYALLPRLASMRAFIIDVRGCPGGNSSNADAVAQAFISGQFANERVRHRVHIGAYKAWGWRADFSRFDMSDPWQKKVRDVCLGDLFEDETTAARFPECPLTLDQPVIALEDAATASSAENLLVDLDNIGRVTIMGEQSYGSTGNPLIMSLPGGGRAGICTRACLYPDGREFINTGVKPHVPAAPSPTDLAAGRDFVLDQAFAYLRNN